MRETVLVEEGKQEALLIRKRSGESSRSLTRRSVMGLRMCPRGPSVIRYVYTIRRDTKINKLLGALKWKPRSNNSGEYQSKSGLKKIIKSFVLFF